MAINLKGRGVTCNSHCSCLLVYVWVWISFVSGSSMFFPLLTDTEHLLSLQALWFSFPLSPPRIHIGPYIINFFLNKRC